MPGTHRFSVSVASALTDDEGRFLCIRRNDNGHWEPPGGVVEPGETLHEALVREVEEETGYVVIPGPVTGVYQNMERDIISVVFRCRLAAGARTLSDESAEVEWLSPSQVEERMDEAYAVRLLDALSADASPARPHDGFHLVPHLP